MAVGGPPRQFAVEARLPEWITSTPGIATVPALGAAYVGLFAAGHGVPRLVVGPAKGSPAVWHGGRGRPPNQAMHLTRATCRLSQVRSSLRGPQR
jgi:hypothetical protein